MQESTKYLMAQLYKNDIDLFSTRMCLQTNIYSIE